MSLQGYDRILVYVPKVQTLEDYRLGRQRHLKVTSSHLTTFRSPKIFLDSDDGLKIRVTEFLTITNKMYIRTLPMLRDGTMMLEVTSEQEKLIVAYSTAIMIEEKTQSAQVKRFININTNTHDLAIVENIHHTLVNLCRVVNFGLREARVFTQTNVHKAYLTLEE